MGVVATQRVPELPVGSWRLEPGQARISFTVRHLLVQRVQGRFELSEGTIKIADPIEESSLEVTMRADSVNTGIERRDRHLHAPEFFDADRYPMITFESESISDVGVGPRPTANVPGRLCMRGRDIGINLSVTLDEVRRAGGAIEARFGATATLDRTGLGIRNPVVSRLVRISVDAVATLVEDT